ncbi:MAG: hypothetical protein B7Y41_11485 [Hydrogenophilales bacterium 28-61-23]|nr:MAG: hypothetical protein B7Y41_11485 [Hydrogenophilales bacterium 28-61-23]
MNRLVLPALLVLLNGQAWAFPWYAQGDNVRGAQLMTQDERKDYVARLQSMKSVDECKGYMQAHILEIDKRAKEHNVPLPPVQGDPCEVMKTMGRIR